MEIKASVTYDYAATSALYYVCAFKKEKPLHQLIWLSALCVILFCLCLGFILHFGYTPLFAVCMMLSLAMLAVTFTVYFYMPKKHYKNIGSTANTTNHYIFSTDSVQIISEGSHTTGESVFQYNGLFKVMETSRYMFLFINKMQALVVDKSTFENGTSDEIRAILQPLFGKKYIICKY